MTKLYYGSVLSDGIRIQYYMTGEEKPPIMLVHGFTDNGFCWNRIPVHLARIYNVVVMDTRGHGFSGCGNEPFSLHDEARDMMALVEELHLHKPVIMGHSHGASIAATAVVDYPDTFSATILIDPPWEDKFFNQTDEERRISAEEWRTVVNKMKKLPHEKLIRMGKQKNPTWDDSDFFQWAQSKYQMRDEAILGILLPYDSLEEALPKIKCPGLILTGNPEKGALVNPETIERVKRLWKNVEVVNFPEAGHNIHRECYREVLNTVDPFLKRIRRANA
jgi:N-formylmaleamate deformylase